ncbi:MAG: threonine aldolase family protein, partial [Ornithinimicrobium sp.]
MSLLADLRSDTLTTPTPAMREAMAAAPVGDDVYGEDPTVAELEGHVAELLGKPAALFTPTGTMAGQLGIREHVAPGAELIADADSHVLRAEMGAAAALSGITTRSWTARHGRLDPAAVADLIAPARSPYLVATACVVVENTHNFGGGTVQPLQAMQEVAEVATRRGAAVHLDGARLWNAHVATGVPLADYAACAQTVAVCLSKGLGAPVGSLMVGSAEA